MIKKLSIAAALFLSLVLLSDQAISGEILRWKDDSGSIHYSESILEVPPKYRDQVDVRYLGDSPKQDTNGKKPNETHALIEPPAEEIKKPKLKKYKVPFRRWQGDARRIIVNVTFNNKVTAPMILDTGAPSMMISYTLARKLGLASKNHGLLLTQSAGIGGTAPSILTIIDKVKIGNAEDSFIPTRLGRFRRGGYYEGLIGMDFMSRYSMKVDHSQGVLEFEELPKSSSMPGGHDKWWWKNTYKEFVWFRTAWRKEVRKIEEFKKSPGERGYNPEFTNQYLSLAKYQKRESEKLFSKLDRYASSNAVPTSWRKFR